MGEDKMAIIHRNESAGPGVHRMTLTHIGPMPQPGQFAMISVPGKYLPRPLSIESASSGVYSVAYKITGPGTEIM